MTPQDPGSPRLSTAERHWSLAAAMACVAVFGAGIGLAAPLLSLTLEARGYDSTVTGLNAAATFVGVVLGPLLTPGLVARFGLRRFMMACLAGDAALFLLLKPLDSIAAWFVIRMALGLVGSGIFTATEAWISLLATDAGRGRIIGVYAATLSLGFGSGPLLLSFAGMAGWTPFLLNAAICAAAALPLLALGERGVPMGRKAAMSPLRVLAETPAIVIAVALFGAFETGAIALLPVWGVRIGLDMRHAAATLTAIYFGAIALQYPVGWLSDHAPRRRVLRLCGAAGLVGSLLGPLVGGETPLMYAALFFCGGLASGLYPVALAMAGDRFRGAELIAANAALIMSYGIGSFIGPIAGGYAMDLWNPHGLLAFFALLFATFLATTLRHR
jgi:MFS family permease